MSVISVIPWAMVRPRVVSMVVRHRAAAAVGGLAILVLLGHVAYLSLPPYDIDAINFALGVREFDVARHQPHPPGAPVYIALGKAAMPVARALGLPAHPSAGLEPVALALLSSIAGALLPLALWHFFRAIDPNRQRAALAAALAVTCPLAWLFAARPMSDLPGLAVTTVAQALLLGTGRRRMVAGAATAGLAVGIRIQAALLVVPLLALLLWQAWGLRRYRVVLHACAACAIVMLVWSAVLAFHGGGPAAYADSVVKQTREDLSSDSLAWSSASARRAALVIAHTVVYPWGSPALAIVILVLALGGALSAVRARAWRELGTIGLVSLPYTLFHFGFQDPWTVRYALPLVPPLAYLAALGVWSLPRRAVPVAAAAVLALMLGVSTRTLSAHAASGSPLFRLLPDMRARAEALADPLVLSQFDQGVALGQAEALVGGPPSWRRLQTVSGREWLRMADIWRRGDADRLWFIAGERWPERALVDPWSLRLAGVYRHAAAGSWLLAGSRPAAINWWELSPPNWIALEGWSQTPETAGVATRDGKGPHLFPIVALVRPLDVSAMLVVGGRHLGAAGSPDARVTINLAGREIDRFEINARDRAFLRTIDIPPNSLGRGYVPLTVFSRTADLTIVPVGIEQFDYQPTDRAVFGFADGWHEAELNPATGRGWRWTSGRADLWIHAPGDVRVSVAGESPRRYFKRPARFAARAGGVLVAERELAGDYREEICVPADLLRASNGRLTLESDRTFVPATRGRSPDRRVLGLRVFDLTVRDAQCVAVAR